MEARAAYPGSIGMDAVTNTISSCSWLVLLYLAFALGVTLKFVADLSSQRFISLKRALVTGALVIVSVRVLS
jgi:hypothetical protein